MSDYETIQLVGGPANGQIHKWDGGNHFSVEVKPTTLFGNATAAFRELMVRKHTYIRDPIQRDQFIYQGEPV